MFERLDGSVSGLARQQAIDRFSDPDSDSFIFMLSTRAGGVGINLTAADTVIMFDPDWNPQNDVQAMARCHRIGQVKTVQVYKLCTKGTYENHMLKLANHKLGLEHAIMRTGEHGEKALTSTGFAKTERPSDAVASQRASQIEHLLKSGAQLLMSPTQEGSKAPHTPFTRHYTYLKPKHTTQRYHSYPSRPVTQAQANSTTSYGTPPAPLPTARFPYIYTPALPPGLPSGSTAAHPPRRVFSAGRTRKLLPLTREASKIS